MAVYCKYHAEHMNTLCEQNAEFLMLNLVVCMYVCACVLYIYVHTHGGMCLLRTYQHTYYVRKYTHTSCYTIWLV